MNLMFEFIIFQPPNRGSALWVPAELRTAEDERKMEKCQTEYSNYLEAAGIQLRAAEDAQEWHKVEQPRKEKKKYVFCFIITFLFQIQGEIFGRVQRDQQ